MAVDERAPFRPSGTTARTPPSGFSKSQGGVRGAGGGKRPLDSPDSGGECSRQRMGSSPPIGGSPATATGPARSPPSLRPPVQLPLSRAVEGDGRSALSASWPSVAEVSPSSGGTARTVSSCNVGGESPMEVEAATREERAASVKTRADTEELYGEIRFAVEGIMQATKSTTSKLNKADMGKISAHGRRILGVMGMLAIRLAEAETRACRAEVAAAGIGSVTPVTGVTAAAPGGRVPVEARVDYSAVLRTGLGDGRRAKPPNMGPVLAVYPSAESADRIKTAELTRAELRSSVNPSTLGVQVSSLRKVGNAGVMLQTTSKAAAEKLRKAVPASLRVTEPRRRRPLVALPFLEREYAVEELCDLLKSQNFCDDANWSKERLMGDVKIAFMRRRKNSPRRTVVLEVSHELRAELLGKPLIYVGWDAVKPHDHIAVTCCNRCQCYGHPERYCRAKTDTCGRCGVDGHRSDACEGVVACATCKRFNKPGAGDHRTMSPECPARRHAEDRQLNIIFGYV